MTRVLPTAAVFLLISALCYGQTDGVKKRGSIPQEFSLPPQGATLHFTSPLPPQLVKPDYPAVHRENDFEGVAELSLYVTAEGDVVYAEVSVGSGDEAFDEEALRAALKSRFPSGYAMLDGTPTDFRISVPYYFLLASDPENYWHTRLELARVQQQYEVVMREFQGLAHSRSSREKAESIRKRLEDRVAAAKRLHRQLAEKKELAILRLRDEIASAKETLDGSGRPATARNTQREIPPEQVPTTVVAVQQVNIISNAEVVSANDIDRLNQELEIKKSYL